MAFSLQGFHEQRMPFVLRLLWCVLLLPCPEMMEVIGQHLVAPAFFLAVSLFRGRLSDMGLDSVLLPVVVTDTEIVSQLHSGGFAGQSEQTGNKINCISVRLASETMETLVHLHAGILVIVAAVGAVVGFASSVVSDIITAESPDKIDIDWGGAVINAVTGALGGALTASGAGIGLQIAGSAAIAAAGNAADQIRGIANGSEDSFDVGSMMLDAFVGGICGAISGPGASAVPGSGGQKQMINLGKATVKRTVNATKHGGLKKGVQEAIKAAKYYRKSTVKITKNLFSKQVAASQLLNFGYNTVKKLNSQR